MADLDLSRLQKIERINGEEYIVLTNAETRTENGRYPLSKLKEELVIQGSTEFNGIATPQTEAPALDGYWVVTDAGKYPNFGGVELPTSSIGFIVKKGNEFIISYVGIEGDYLKKSEKIPNENLTFGEVKEGDLNVVSGGEVFDKVMTKEVYLETTYTYTSKNLFDKNSVQIDKSINTNGLITDTQGNGISNYIPVKKNTAYIISGWFGNQTLKRVSIFKNIGDLNPIERFNTNTFTPAQDGYMCALIYTSLGQSNGLDYRDTCQIEVGSVATEYEPYTPPIIEEKIKDKYLLITDEVVEIDLKRVDKRFSDKSNYDQLTRDLSNYDNFYKSLSSVRDGGVEKTITINSSTEQDNLVIPISVHYGNNVGDSNPTHLFFEKGCKENISDIRFFDENNNELDVLKKEYVNAETIFDNKLMFFTASLSNGDLIAYNTQEDGMYKSEDDGVTWVKFKEVGSIVGVAPNDNILYEIGDKLYLTTSESGYTDEILKLTNDMPGGTWGWQHWIVDALGNCFTAPYQEGWNVKVYKSTDNGITWIKTYDVVGESQHVHSFCIDKTNNHMYVNCDAGEPNWNNPQDPKSQRTLVSKDFGNTWKRLEIPFPTDYGIVYANAERNIWLTSGESAIKSMPTLSISRDLKTWTPLIESTANGGTIKELNNVLYFFQRSHSTNQYVKILVSKDFGLTWNEFLSTGQITPNDMGCTYGRGSNLNVIGKDGREYFVIGSNNQYVNKLPRARIYAGSENHQCMYYVKLKKAKQGANVITAKSGYLTDVIDSNLYEDYTHPNLVCHLPLNSETASVIDIMNKKEYDLQGDFEWGNLDKREMGWIYPFIFKAKSSALHIDRTKPIIIDDILKKDKDFSVSFWFKFEHNYLSDATKTRHLFGRSNDTLSFYSQRENRLVYKLGGMTKIIAGTFKIENNRVFTHITVTIDGSNIKTYVNGNISRTTPYVYTPNTNYDKWTIMGDLGLNTTDDKDFISDLMVFDKVLNDKEVLRIFESNNKIL